MTARKHWVVRCDGDNCNKSEVLNGDLSRKEVDYLLKGAKIRRRGKFHYCSDECDPKRQEQQT